MEPQPQFQHSSGIYQETRDTIGVKQRLFSLLKRVWVPPESIYKHLHFHGVFPVEHDDCHFVIQHYGYQVENEIFWSGLTGSWEKISLSMWIKLCAQSSIIFDIGANTGVYSLVAKAVNPLCTVHAFEPVPRVIEKLRANCRINAFEIACHEVAASDNDGEGIIFDPCTEHVYSVTVNGNRGAASGAIPKTVPTVRLDTFIDQLNIKKIDLMKIDVETHEPEVLAGMGRHLAAMRPTMLVEILGDDFAARIESLVKDIGYIYFDIDERGQPRREKRLSKSSGYNWLLCNEDKARSLMLI